jgi:outer membrane protein
MNKSQIIIFLITVLLCQITAAAVLKLDQDLAVSIALEKHRDTESILLDLKEYDIQSAELRARLLPKLIFNMDAPTITESRDEIWTTIGDSAEVLVWKDWSQRRESGNLQLLTELPLGTTISAGLRAYHRSSDSEGITEQYGNTWSFSFTQRMINPKTLLGDLSEGKIEKDIQVVRITDRLAELRQDVITSFYSLLRMELAYELNGDVIQQSNLSLQKTIGRYQAGMIAESDYLKVELDNLKRQANRASDSLTLILERESFMRTIGLASETEFELERNVPVYDTPLDFDTQWDDLLSSNLALSDAAFTIKKSRRNLRAARIELLPEVDLNFSWQSDYADDEFDFDISNGNINRSAGLSLSWALFNRGADSRVVQRAKISFRKAEIRQEQLIEDLRVLLIRKMARLQELEIQIPLVKRQLELADRDLEISRERYASGLISSQDLIDAEHNLSTAQISLLNSKIDLVLSIIDINRITGRDRQNVIKVLQR